MSDNLTTPVPAGTVLATKDLGGGRQLPLNGLLDQAGADAMGAVTAAPAANTLLARLKDIADAIVARLPLLGTRTAAGSVSVTPASDGFAVSVNGVATAAKQDLAKTVLDNIQAAATSLEAATVYVPIAFASTNLTGGACRAIIAETAGRVKLKQPDGTVRDNFPLFAGLNPIGALMIDAPTAGTAATGIWAIYS